MWSGFTNVYHVCYSSNQYSLCLLTDKSKAVCPADTQSDSTSLSANKFDYKKEVKSNVSSPNAEVFTEERRSVSSGDVSSLSSEYNDTSAAAATIGRAGANPSAADSSTSTDTEEMPTVAGKPDVGRPMEMLPSGNTSSMSSLSLAAVAADDVRRSRRTNSLNRELNHVGSSSTGGPSNGRQTNRRRSKDKSAKAKTITSKEMIAQAKSDISSIIIPTVPNNNDVVMIQEDDRCNTVSEQRAGSSTRGSSNRRPSKDKSANAKTIPSIDMIAQAMFDINASVTSDKKQDIAFDQLVGGTKKAHELDENGEQNTDGRAVVHQKLFAGGDNRDTNSTDLGIVSIKQISTGIDLGEVFGKSECYNLIGGTTTSSGCNTKQQYEALVKGEIDSFNLKDFEMTRHDKKNGMAAAPTNDQLAKINTIKKQYNPNEANQTTNSNGRVAATTAIANTFHNNQQGRPHQLFPKTKRIITAPSLSGLVRVLKCIQATGYNKNDGKITLCVHKAMKSVPAGGSLDWKGGITIEYFDEKKHGKYVDDTGGISVKGKKVKSSGKQNTAKRRKKGKGGERYTS